jgi:hypothetical protein
MLRRCRWRNDVALIQIEAKCHVIAKMRGLLVGQAAIEAARLTVSNETDC